MNTVKINVSFLAGPALDWVVCVCEKTQMGAYTRYSTDWAQGGPIIEREGIELVPQGQGLWDAMKRDQHIPNEGPTPLIAAMRCYVASKLGEIVEVPSELYKEESYV